MKYLILAGIVYAIFILNLFVGRAFKVRTNDRAPEYIQILKDHSKNIFNFGLSGVFGLFLGNTFGGWISYVVIGIFGFLTVIDIFRMIVMIGTTVLLSFTKGYKGIADTGKLSDWLILLSSLIESGVMVFLTYKMYLEFFS